MVKWGPFGKLRAGSSTRGKNRPLAQGDRHFPGRAMPRFVLVFRCSALRAAAPCFIVNGSHPIHMTEHRQHAGFLVPKQGEDRLAALRAQPEGDGRDGYAGSQRGGDHPPGRRRESHRGAAQEGTPDRARAHCAAYRSGHRVLRTGLVRRMGHVRRVGRRAFGGHRHRTGPRPGAPVHAHRE